MSRLFSHGKYMNVQLVHPPVANLSDKLSTIADNSADNSLVGETHLQCATEVPKTRLNLSSIKGYEEKRKSIKANKLKAETIIELQKAFDIFDPNELKLNHSVVLFVAQVVEDIFNKPKQGPLKKEVVIEICKQYFNGEEALVEMVLELVFPKIIKTTLWRRNKQRLKNLTIFFFEIFGPSIQTNLSNKLKL